MNNYFSNHTSNRLTIYNKVLSCNFLPIEVKLSTDLTKSIGLKGFRKYCCTPNSLHLCWVSFLSKADKTITGILPYIPLAAKYSINSQSFMSGRLGSAIIRSGKFL